VFFDDVGVNILDAFIDNLADDAPVSVCVMGSQQPRTRAWPAKTLESGRQDLPCRRISGPHYFGDPVLESAHRQIAVGRALAS